MMLGSTNIKERLGKRQANNSSRFLSEAARCMHNCTCDFRLTFDGIPMAQTVSLLFDAWGSKPDKDQKIVFTENQGTLWFCSVGSTGTAIVEHDAHGTADWKH